MAMIKRKDKTIQRKMFKFFENIEVVNTYLKEALHQIGWLSSKDLKAKDKNLIKADNRTVLSEIIEFSKNNIEFVLEIKNIGNQTLSFAMEPMKRGVVLEMSSKIHFLESMEEHEKKKNIQHIQNSFHSNAKDIDTLIRDLLEKDGYKSFY